MLSILLFICSCVAKPRNTTCTNHGTYLNYIDDVKYLLQLEYEAMNYIEANVTNQYCRNYLKAALCVTIYPPCDGSGVQKLCSEVCDSILNSGTCSFDTRYLTEYVTQIISNSSMKFTMNCSNSSMKFTINCSNSLGFSVSFLNTMPSQSGKCVSLAEIAKIPPR